MTSANNTFRTSLHSFFEKYHTLLFLLLLFVSLFLRLYDLPDNPPGLYIDEISSAYNAYSILQTGKDEHGVWFPLYFEAFGEYRHGFFIYSMIPSLLIFGLNDLGTRFTAVLFGVAAVALLYFFVSSVFDKKVGLLSAALLAIQPWHTFLSRVAFEGISFVFLFLVGLFFFYKGLEREKKMHWFCAAVLFFALCVFSYGIAKLFVPLFLIGIAFIYRNFFREHKNVFITCVFLFLVLVSPFYFFSFFDEGNARFQQGSIFALSKHPIFTFLFNYISHYTPSFLFFSGDAGLRHHLYDWGFLFPGDLVFVLGGLLFVFQHRTEKRYQMLLLWLLLFPVAASFMYGDTPHGLRAFIGAPLFAVLGALGVFFIFEKGLFFFTTPQNAEKQRTITILFTLIIFFLFVVQAGFYYYEYFTDYKTYSYDYWMAYNEPMLEYVVSVRDQYEHVYFSANSMDRMSVFFLYYLKIDPTLYLTSGLENTTGYRICDINSCYNESQHNLYVFKGFELKEANGLHQIYYPDNKTIAVKFVE